ncbi:MAG: heparin lyase I family protein [Bacteroidota bacterium]
MFECQKFSFDAGLDQWHTFVWHVVTADQAEDGLVELWHNGNQIFSVKRPIFKPGAKNGEWKYGLYVGDPNHGTRQVYTDEFYAGDNFNSIGEFLNATTYGLSCPIPTGLTVSNITDTTACLDWDNVSDTVVYDLLWREKGG